MCEYLNGIEAKVGRMLCILCCVVFLWHFSMRVSRTQRWTFVKVKDYLGSVFERFWLCWWFFDGGLCLKFIYNWGFIVDFRVNVKVWINVVKAIFIRRPKGVVHLLRYVKNKILDLLPPCYKIFKEKKIFSLNCYKMSDPPPAPHTLRPGSCMVWPHYPDSSMMGSQG